MITLEILKGIFFEMLYGTCSITILLVPLLIAFCFCSGLGLLLFEGLKSERKISRQLLLTCGRRKSVKVRWKPKASASASRPKKTPPEPPKPTRTKAPPPATGPQRQADYFIHKAGTEGPEVETLRGRDLLRPFARLRLSWLEGIDVGGMMVSTLHMWYRSLPICNVLKDGQEPEGHVIAMGDFEFYSNTPSPNDWNPSPTDEWREVFFIDGVIARKEFAHATGIYAFCYEAGEIWVWQHETQELLVMAQIRNNDPRTPVATQWARANGACAGGVSGVPGALGQSSEASESGGPPSKLDKGRIVGDLRRHPRQGSD